LFAPPPIGGDFQKSLRIGAFFDVGNVWYTKSESTDIVSPIGINLSDLRYSAGVSATWLSPVGVIAVSLAYPINPKGGDDTQVFQFSLGQLF
jgi:outer membrane protein insertion porin family